MLAGRLLRSSSLRNGAIRASISMRSEAPAAGRRAVVLGSRQTFSTRRYLSGSAFQLDPPEETMMVASGKPEEGVDYELNWSLCGSGVVPLGKAFRNMRLAELSAAGGSANTADPKEVSFESVLKEVKGVLGDSSTTLYVQDCALGTVLANEIPVRIVTDNAAVAAAFKTFCAAARTVPLPQYEEDVTVLHTSTAKSPYISSDKKQKTVLMGDSFNVEALVKHIEAISGDAFLARGVLPMFGAGADNIVYLDKGFQSGAAVKYGFSFSSAGFCRLYGADGSSLPNSLPLPKAVVMFANDATGAIPAASALDAAQAAFYYVGACAPKSMTNMEAAASLMLQLGAKTKVYMINKAAYGSAAEAQSAAKTAVGQTGSKGALGLNVIAAGKADQATIDKMAQSLTSTVSAKVKKSDAVLKAGPPLPPPPTK